MKKIILGLALLLICHILIAQTQQKPKRDYKRGFSFGLNIGANAATRNYKSSIGQNPPKNSFLLKPSGGMVFNWRLAKGFYLQTDLSYQQKGDKIDVNKWLQMQEFPSLGGDGKFEAIANGFRTTKLDYAQLSFMPIFGIGSSKVQFLIGGGAYGAFGFRGNQVSDYEIEYLLDNKTISKKPYQSTSPVKFVSFVIDEKKENEIYLKSLDYGWQAYGGLKFNKIMLSLTLSQGLKPIELTKTSLEKLDTPPAFTTNVCYILGFTYLF